MKSDHDDSDFLLSARSPQFELIEHATNDIFSIFEFLNEPLKTNAMMTRSASKRHLLSEVQ